ncbi:MAG TPA: YfhO family protein, partial [Myxococcales bacterium]|nr:YfhO family protein [Myxococcales bacterium]
AAYSTSLLLAAAGVLPGLTLLPQTTRGALSFSEAATWSLHPWRLLELVWPFALGNPLDASRNLAELVANSGAGELSPSWSLSLYLGAPILALALLSALRKERRAMLAGAVFLTFLAVGAYSPLYSFFRGVFPPERVIRYPEKHIAGAICILCALAGAGISQVRTSQRTARWLFVGTAASLAIPLAALALLRPWLLHKLGADAALLSPPLELPLILEGSLRSGALSLAVAAAVSCLLLRSNGAGIALYLAHAIWAAWDITPLGSPERFARVPQLLRGTAREPTGPPRRLLRSSLADAELLPETMHDAWHETLYLDSPCRFGFAAVPGFEGWRSTEFASLWRRAGGMPVQTFATLFAIDFVALPAGQRTLGSLFELEAGAAEDSPDGKVAWTLIRNKGVRPRAFVAPRWRWTSPGTAVDALLDPLRARDPDLVVLSGAGTSGTSAERLTPCQITHYSPERVSMLCDSPSGGYAVLADEYAAGWTAAVDEEPAAISRADVLLRAVRVGPGAHRVDFVYRTPLLRTGIFISICSWVGWGALLLRTRRSTLTPAPAG